MRALYRTSFEIRSASPQAKVFDEVADLCWAWIFNSKRGPSYAKAPAKGAVSCNVAGLPSGHSIQSIATAADGRNAWGIVFRHPDQQDRNLSWQTEAGIMVDAEGRLFFACSSLVGRSDSSLAPALRSPSRPRIVGDVLERLGGFGAFKLTSRALSLAGTDKAVDQMVGFLENPMRTHPVVFISVHEQSGTHLVDPTKVAQLLGGLAHVVVARDAQANRLFNARVAFRLNCFAGGIRVYWPGFSRSSPGWQHPLWTTEQIVEQESRCSGQTSFTILRALADVAAFNIHANFLTWERLQEMDRRRAIAEAIASNQQSDLLKLYEDDNASLNVRVRQLQAELAAATQEVHQQRSLAESYRLAFEQRKNAEPSSAETALPPSSVREAVERAEKKYAGQLVFSLNSNHPCFLHALREGLGEAWLAAQAVRTPETECDPVVDGRPK